MKFCLPTFSLCLGLVLVIWVASSVSVDRYVYVCVQVLLLIGFNPLSFFRVSPQHSNDHAASLDVDLLPLLCRLHSGRQAVCEQVCVYVCVAVPFDVLYCFFVWIYACVIHLFCVMRLCGLRCIMAVYGTAPMCACVCISGLRIYSHEQV